jgi:hypothetical protein
VYQAVNLNINEICERAQLDWKVVHSLFTLGVLPCLCDNQREREPARAPARAEAMGDNGMSLFALSLEQLTQLKQSIEEVRLTATMNAAPA